ncbi:MAG: hypothetical protein NTY33_01800 [Candidatus Moranbacteria bacterium]|nr:hypothetical protein [Candidatus Moranbacteria bacterium]
MDYSKNHLLKNQKIAVVNTRNPRIWLTDSERIALEKSDLALRLWIKLTYKVTLNVWLHWSITNWELQKSNPQKTSSFPNQKKSVGNLENEQRADVLKLLKRYTRIDASGNEYILMKLSRAPYASEISAHRNTSCVFLEDCIIFASKNKFSFSCVVCPYASDSKKEK